MKSIGAYHKFREETRAIWGVGRNYADHAKELGNSVPTTPLIFLKAGASLLDDPDLIRLPKWSTNVHHEVELALLLDGNLEISAATVALDLTERDKQEELKKKSQPWTLAKSFVDSCAIGEWIPAKESELANLEIKLTVNDEVRQHGFIRDMIFSPSVILAYLKKHFPLSPGDLILTGTPAGVGPLKPGDSVLGEVLGKVAQNWRVQL